ncbi:hypothetical protein DLM75_20565 [Leptospira stimsonii]|uniref:Uncharacterized protein n=1 Tax=Leptospira stimsonii TaxID=2202203 RepID=A0A396YW82_9LEPT|nr:hypothetical protein DLM75_20565 [Leptospira stimsonii]
MPFPWSRTDLKKSNEGRREESFFESFQENKEGDLSLCLNKNGERSSVISRVEETFFLSFLERKEGDLSLCLNQSEKRSSVKYR